MPQTSLQSHSYQANLYIWTFYLDNNLSQFPPYDTELICEEDLTPMDLHHNFFGKTQIGFPIEPQGSVITTLSSVLHKYTGQSVAVVVALMYTADFRLVARFFGVYTAYR